jgi:hypothetical protein
VRHPSSAYGSRVEFERRPKPGGVRLLCRLDPSLGEDYAAAVAGVAPSVERALGREVLAHRVAVASRVPPAIVLRDWRRERRLFGGELRGIASAALIARADVADCYASVSLAGVEDGLRRCRADRTDADRCVTVLERLAGEGVRGLPVGPVASAVLANAVLAAGDRALRGVGVNFVRWVDDWWIELRSARQAADVLDALATALAGAGLRLNDGKTLVGPPIDVMAAGTPSGAEYHRAADAHPVPVVHGANPLLPGHRRLALGGRAPRRAGGTW